MKKIVTFLLTCALLIGCNAIEKNEAVNNEAVIEEGLLPSTEQNTEETNVDEGDLDLSDEQAVSDTDTNAVADAINIRKYELPSGFVYLDEAVPYVSLDVKYYSEDNFVGTIIDGYNAPLAIGTVEMAEALRLVSEELYEQGYLLRIYDAYRPAKAVAYFKSWSSTEDMKMKQHYYPNESKSELFKLGYLASKSGHSRGSTVDLTIVYKDSGELVDMGSGYDVLDEISSFTSKQISEEQRQNRYILKSVMETYGFKAYSKEWWHYTLNKEPYPDTYFDFDVE